FQFFYCYSAMGLFQSFNAKLNDAVAALIPARKPDQLILNKIYLLLHSFQVTNGLSGLPAPSPEKHLRVENFLVHGFVHRNPKQGKSRMRGKLNPDEPGFSCAGVDESRPDSISNEI